MEEKIIFLDIDGVLNSTDYQNSNSCLRRVECDSTGLMFNSPLLKHKTKDGHGNLFDPRCVNWLKAIINITGAKIVISSDWRRNGLSEMQNLWIDRRLSGEVIGITGVAESRGIEIQEYIEAHPVFSYCIIDDLTCSCRGLRNYWVQTESRFGLTSIEANQVVKILNK